jgi:hypothetical protein
MSGRREGIIKKIHSEFYAKPLQAVTCKKKGRPPNYHVFVSFCLKSCAEKNCECRETIKKEVGHGTE